MAATIGLILLTEIVIWIVLLVEHSAIDDLETRVKKLESHK